MNNIRSKNNYKKIVIYLLSMVFIIILLWVAGFIFFIIQVPHEGTITDGQKADAIIVLTGGSGRINAGVELLTKGYAENMLISGVNKDSDLDLIKVKLNNYLKKDLDQLDNKITLGYNAYNTDGNAKEAKNWLLSNGFKSFILVTSNYHIPRSMVEFSSLMPEKKIIPYAVVAENVIIKKCWKYPSSMKLLISEYHKYLFSKLIQFKLIQFL